MIVSQSNFSLLVIFSVYVVSINAYVGNSSTRWSPKVNPYGEPTKSFFWNDEEINNSQGDRLEKLTKKSTIGGILDFYFFLGRYPDKK